MANGKGDAPRPYDGKKFRSNYDRIFKKQIMFRHGRKYGKWWCSHLIVAPLPPDRSHRSVPIVFKRLPANEANP